MAKVGRKMRWGIRVVVLLLLVFFGLRRFEYSQVYAPSKRIVQWTAGNGTNRQNVWFAKTEGPALYGWFFPAATNSPRKNIAVLVCHGNGGNISYLERLYTRIAATGVNVLLFDYRGYGKSSGRPSEEGTYQDAQMAYRWLGYQGFAATNIFLYGQSLGGGVVSELALREPVGGMILESAASCLTDVGVERFPWLPVRLISSIKYDTCKKLPRIKVPVLIMHSREDRVISYRLAEKNLVTANDPKMFWEVKGGHVAEGEDCHVGLEKYFSAIEAARQQGREAKF